MHEHTQHRQDAEQHYTGSKAGMKEAKTTKDISPDGSNDTGTRPSRPVSVKRKKQKVDGFFDVPHNSIDGELAAYVDWSEGSEYLYGRRRRMGLLYSLGVLLCLLLPLLAGSVPGVAQTTSTLAVLHIGHLNFDCFKDTLMGMPLSVIQGSSSASTTQYVPTSIVWGRPDPVSMANCPPIPPGGIPPLVPVSQTIFIYPSWIGQQASVSMKRLNPEDTLDDLIFYLWGKRMAAPPGGYAGHFSEDTVRAFVIFGQEKLSLQPVVLLNQVAPGFQSLPFFAMDLLLETHLVNPEFRDGSGIISYELLPVSQAVQPPPPHGTSGGGNPPQGLAAKVQIYPNPAVYEAALQAESLAPGVYTVTVQSVNGKVCHEQRVQVDASHSLYRLLDVSRLATGYYVVHVVAEAVPGGEDEPFRGTYPIVIVH